MGLFKYYLAYRRRQTWRQIKDEESEPLLQAQNEISQLRPKPIISANSVPQLDWTNEECVTWLNHLIIAKFAVAWACPLEAAQNFKGDGVQLWKTTIWEWLDATHILYGRHVFLHLEHLVETGQTNLDDLRKIQAPALMVLGRGAYPGKRWWAFPTEYASDDTLVVLANCMTVANLYLTFM